MGKSASQIMRQVAERLHPGSGCTDGGCIFGSHGGMGTNGGCQCLKERGEVMLRQLAFKLRDVARTLAAMIPDEEVSRG